MKWFSLLLGLALLPVCAGEEQFLKPENARVIGCAVRKGKEVLINVPPEKAAGLNGVIYKVDLTPCRNSVVTFSVDAQADHLTKPEQRHFGTKFMLLYTTPDGQKHYAESNGHYGTFAKKLTFSHTVSPDAAEAELRFVVQNVSGKLRYDLSTFRIVTSFQKCNIGYQCEYSDAVKARPVHRGVVSPIHDQANEENFRVLQQWNVNLLRLQLNVAADWARNKPELYNRAMDDKIENVIPKVLDLGQKYGIKVIIDLHMVPGGNDTQKNSPGIFGSDEAVTRFVALWERMATKFKDHPALYGYGLFNEPRQNYPTKYDYWEIQHKAAQAIRRIDPETPIYVASNLRSSQYTFDYLSPMKLKNIIYEVYCYDPFAYTHTPYSKRDREAGKPRPTYPGTFYGAPWNLEGVRNRLKAVKRFARDHQAKIYVGEFSTRACLDGADQFLRDYITVFEENQWDWTYHAFREAKIWSLEYAGPSDDELEPSQDNPRKRVLLEAFRKNRS